MVYDGEDRLTQLGYPSGGAANYAYDTDGRITGVTFATGDINPQTGQPYPPVAVVANATYLPNGPLTSLTLGDGATRIVTFRQAS